ncbi:sigma-E factor negative regulatory protein [Rheinheimera sp.]|uniref:sigma-E factor negative regulatory protein n=1 Tax=Rheinheimera sp. TaxID=1869214 RepID=UPI00307E8E50
MSLEKSDWLSAAGDNQAIAPEQLDTLLQDTELQQSFARYHLIGAAIRNELPAQIDLDFADRFAAVLEQETTYQLTAVTPSVVNSSLWQKLADAANNSWARMGMQGAVAAAVALMAVVGVQQFQAAGPDADLNTPLPVLQTQPVAGFATPVSLSQTSVDSRFEQEQRQAMLEQQKRLQQLLQAHHQQIRVMETAQHQAPKAPVEAEKQEN